MDNFFYLHGYFIELEKNGKKPGTIKQYRSDLQQFISWLDTTINQDLLDVDAVAIMSYVAYLKERSYRDTTIKRHLSLVHRFLAFYHVPVDSSSEQENIYRAPPLQSSDFISNNEMDQLLQSMQRPIQSIARDILIPRNLAIVHLMRYQGLRPKEITSITMRMINLAQSTIEFNWNGERINYTLANTHMTYIRDYIATIAPLKRPKWKSEEPLFVSFNNRSNDYQYDYAKVQPKQLSVRSIQEMIKDEVWRADLRKLSAKHLRNSCILDHIQRGESETDILSYFHLTHPFSLYRYKQYKELVDSHTE